MRRRPIALLAAAVLGLLALASPLWRPPAQAPPTHFRVELEVPALDAALWFVARYPGYFRSGEAGLLPWLDGLSAEDREFVLAMAQTLTWTWLEHEARQFTGEDPEALALEASLLVREKTRSQLEVDFGEVEAADGLNLWATIDAQEFAPGVFARLVRGASNCEGQNHLLSALIDVALEPDLSRPFWRPRRARADVTGIAGHNLVMIHGLDLAQPLFADAWSNLAPFCVDPSRPATAALLAELDEHPALVDGQGGRPPARASEYADIGPIPIELLPRRDAPTLPVSLTIRAPKLDEASLARVKDPWRLYLFGRILQLYDDPRAAGVYALLLERHCVGRRRPRPFVCQAAAAFHAGASSPGPR